MITIDELKTKIDKKARLLGIDMGVKNIGISICDDKRLIATPFHTVNFISLDSLVADLKKLIEENSIQAIIIGDPINMDGSHGRACLLYTSDAADE